MLFSRRLHFLFPDRRCNQRDSLSTHRNVHLKPDLRIRPSPALAGFILSAYPKQIMLGAVIDHDMRDSFAKRCNERQRWVKLQQHGKLYLVGPRR